ncbi:MAG TPA: HWE histidine kinase domain-containing protein [Aestuariivirgaceae bacterium]|nr:HWE histidine kinase domain-containing protein [Aestuariivirgaceae bacterium]
MLKRQDSASPAMARLAKAINEAAPAVWDWDLATDTLLATRRLHDIYGFPETLTVRFEDLHRATFGPDVGWMDDLLKGNSDLPDGGVYRFRINRADTGELRWIRAHVIATPHVEQPQRAASYTATIEDVTEESRANFALRESEVRLRLAIEAGRMAVWEVDLESGTVTNSPALNLMFGLPKDATPTFAELRAHYAPGEVERLAAEGASLEAVRRRFASGEVVFRRHQGGPLDGEDRTQVQAELSIIVPSGMTKRLLYRAQYAYSLEGRPRITGLLVDITDRKLAEERLAVVARELQHRVKNSLAVVQTLATQSFRNAPHAQDAAKAFLDRLYALAKATNIILDSATQDAELAELVEAITKPYRLAQRNAFVIAGEPVRVTGKVATALSMVLHELSTNAVKYGALSVSSGHVRLAWRSTPDKRLLLDWEERGGPAVEPVPEKGFGTELLEILVGSDLAGTLEIRFEPEGLVCRIATGKILP